MFAWIRYGPTAVYVAGWATEWTEHAVAMLWLTPTGVEHRAWVWQGATRSRRDVDLGALTSRADKGARLVEEAAREVVIFV